MSRYTASGLLTPPREEEEIYPYRPVWASVIIEMALLFGLSMGSFVIGGFLGIELPAAIVPIVNLLLALSPMILWGFFSYIREQSVPQPRTRLLAVFVISALVANAITFPILNYFQFDKWLSLLETVDHVVGYTLTIGIVFEFSKYVVLRLTIWPDYIRIRTDTIAYSLAAAIGYVTIVNLHFIGQAEISFDLVAARVFANTVFQVAGSMFIAYGLAEVRFNRRSLFLMPSTLLLAALMHGLGATARGGFVNAGFVLGTAATRPLFGIIVVFVLIVSVLATIITIFTAAERREREAELSREI